MLCDKKSVRSQKLTTELGVVEDRVSAEIIKDLSRSDLPKNELKLTICGTDRVSEPYPSQCATRFNPAVNIY